MSEHPQSSTRTAQCQCAMGDECSTIAPGHRLHLLQQRVAAATGSKWRDAVIESVSADGWIGLVALDDDQRVRVWHHSQLGSSLSVGDPVALHSLYHVLAVGSTWLNVLVPAASDPTEQRTA